MNFFGFNGAAFNGGVSGIIAGAAIVVASCGASAEGTRIQLAEGVSLSSASTSSAIGVRNVFGAGISTAIHSGSAQWALLTQASAEATCTISIKATYTDAYSLASAYGNIAGTITRPGAGVSTTIFVASSSPLVTVGYASNISIASQVTADASVKLSGQSTVQRDGYAQTVAISASVIPVAGLRTALSSSSANATSAASSLAIRIQGGAAQIDCQFSAVGTPSTESAITYISSSVIANGLITRYGASLVAPNFTISNRDTVNTNGRADTINATAICSADGRLAIRGESIAASSMAVVSDAIYGLLGNAASSSTASVSVEGVIYKLGSATALCQLNTDPVSYAILRYGAAAITVSSSVSAIGSLNIEATDPDQRTMRRPFNNREMIRPFINKEMKR